MKTEPEDLTTDDTVGENTRPSDTDLARQFTHPGYMFKGQQLGSYTAGTDLLFNQVLDQNDAPYFVFLSFIFIHLKDRAEMIPLCWDKQKFRCALLDWIDSLGPLTQDDKTEAMHIFEDMRGAARDSTVEVVPQGRAEKKTKAKRRPLLHA